MTGTEMRLMLVVCVLLVAGCAGNDKTSFFETKSEMAERRCQEAGLEGTDFKKCVLAERRHIERQVSSARVPMP